MHESIEKSPTTEEVNKLRARIEELEAENRTEYLERVQAEK